MERHFTATVYIFDAQDRVLLHRHEKLQKWLPPGGHVEPNETPPEAARREALEETGLEIVFIEQENLKIEAYNAISFERPFFCLLEHIPAHKEKPAHQHMDCIYLARPKLHSPKPLGDFRWFRYEELTEIQEELFPDTQAVLTLLLKEGKLRELSLLPTP